MDVFRKKNWVQYANVLEQKAIDDTFTFSHFDNTFPHLKIFAFAFADSHAYLHSDPLTVNLSGAREWSSFSPLINIVRLIEALDAYRQNGLPLLSYLRCKNFALRTFLPDYIRMFIRKDSSGFRYIRPFYLLMNSLLYPNAWISPFYYLISKIRKRIYMIFELKS